MNASVLQMTNPSNAYLPASTGVPAGAFALALLRLLTPPRHGESRRECRRRDEHGTDAHDLRKTPLSSSIPPRRLDVDSTHLHGLVDGVQAEHLPGLACPVSSDALSARELTNT